ncbi:AarF/ABC1/UbiB kinase family protein [archaeon]|nr:AarF/ABC1/UbiB kinase family protein [archaeon]
MPSKIRDIKRITQVVRTLLKHGFGRIIYDHGLKRYLPFHKQPFVYKKLPEDLPEKLRLVFEELGGAYVKLGQLLSLRSDLIPQEYCDEFRKLQDRVSPVYFDQIKKLIDASLGEAVFDEIKEKPLGSASIAQVHKAKLKNNKWVVVKVQRPFVKEDFETDIDIMYYIARKLQKKFKEFYPVAIVEEFENYTRNELNFVHEAKNIDRFHNIFLKDPHVKIPRVYWQYTTKNILVMEYLKGEKLSILKKEEFNHRKIAETIVAASVKQIFEHGVFHADLHPGNILVVDDEKISLLDFGIIGTLSSELRTLGLKLFVSLVDRDIDEIMSILLKIGEPSKETNLKFLKEDIENILNSWYDENLETTHITQVLYLLVNTCVKHKIKLPIDIILYAKSFLTAEGTCKFLVPDFNFIVAIQPHILRVLQKENTPQKIISKFVKKSQKLADAVLKIPGETFELLEKLKSGRFSFDLEDTDIKHLGMDINLSSNRLSIAIIVAALVISGAMLAELKPQYAGYSLISIFCLTFAAIMMASLVISIHREGNQRFDPHRKV